MYTDKLTDSKRWHQRFCHVNIKNIQELSKRDLVDGLDSISITDIHCNSCSVSKLTKAPCKTLSCRQTKNVTELIHSDLRGPMPIETNWWRKVYLNIY